MKRNKIQARLLGRLGNQMFIYAFVRRVALDFDMDAYMILGEEKNRLDCFKIPTSVKFIHQQQYSLKQKTGDFIYRLMICGGKTINQMTKMEEKYRSLLESFDLFYSQEGCMEPTNRHSDMAVLGYFQSEDCFKNQAEAIKNDFTFNDSIKQRCKVLADEILTCESCCLHIRLGDYLNDKIFGVCNSEYYFRAIAKMKELKPNTVFYVFSDNIDTAKKLFEDTDSEFYYIPLEYTDQESVYLGNCCKNYVISNSTFSWWMQYLSKNPDKTVIAPSRWFNDERPCHIYQSNWTLVEV
ncbi:MAG: alpha-1,2-fucosyltransferase, partial [Prevotella sp.]